jgi:sulfoxide reductase heme-binding subunit YedZ
LKQLKDASLRRIQVLVFLACLLPLLRLLIDLLNDELGADPVEAITHSTGDWALNLLLITLTITPLRKLSGWHWLARLRRELGLFCFFYAALHVLAYLLFDQSFEWRGIVQDIGKRPFITAGFLAFVLLIPLALTSTDDMVRRLGGRRWLRLHRLAYLAAAAAVFHYLWLVKRDISQPAAYAVALCLLLGARILLGSRRRRLSAAAPSAAPRYPQAQEPENHRPCR